MLSKLQVEVPSAESLLLGVVKLISSNLPVETDSLVLGLTGKDDHLNGTGAIVAKGTGNVEGVVNKGHGHVGKVVTDIQADTVVQPQLAVSLASGVGGNNDVERKFSVLSGRVGVAGSQGDDRTSEDVQGDGLVANIIDGDFAT